MLKTRLYANLVDHGVEGRSIRVPYSWIRSAQVAFLTAFSLAMQTVLVRLSCHVCVPSSASLDCRRSEDY